MPIPSITRFSPPAIWNLVFGFVIALAGVSVSAERADAHALGADCRIRDGRAFLEAYFSDDTPVRHAKVEVKDAAGKIIAEGKTDDEGRWSFVLPEAGAYQAVVDAGMGHRTTVAFAVSKEQLAADEAEKLEGVRVGAGPDRERFTRVPWLRVGIGLGVISALALVLHLWFRRLRPAMAHSQGEAPQ
jgi:nickel transport protein